MVVVAEHVHGVAALVLELVFPVEALAARHGQCAALLRLLAALLRLLLARLSLGLAPLLLLLCSTPTATLLIIDHQFMDGWMDGWINSMVRSAVHSAVESQSDWSFLPSTS